MHYKNKQLLENQISNMNKTFKNPAKDDADDLLLKNYDRTYGRPKKSSSPQLSPRSSKIKKGYWKKQSAIINSSLKETFDNAAQDDDDDDEFDEKMFKKSHGNSSRVQDKLNIPESSNIHNIKSKWYNALYPTYKSRLEEFKMTFLNMPDDERLVVDYSCGLQKDVFIHGRLYLSQNYICFYSKTYMSETSIILQWSDIVSITKDKSTIVPNAILLSTKNDKFLLTTFGASDKTYTMMLKIWKSALINQPLSNEETWQLIHTSYGDELGLSSDDDDDKSFPNKYLGDSFSEFEASFMAHSRVHSRAHSTFSFPNENKNISLKLNNNFELSNNKKDLNDPSEDDSENDNLNKSIKNDSDCTDEHDGREIINTTIPINIDQLFILLFTGSKFFFDFHTSRNTKNLIQSAWIKNQDNGLKMRNITMTVSLNQSVGPKTSQVSEKQIMLPYCSPGSKYSIDIETTNAGIPYADSFVVNTHFCMTALSECETNIKIHSKVDFKKDVWAMMKSLILKNCWNGLEEFYGSLIKSVALECADINMKDNSLKNFTKTNETYVCSDKTDRANSSICKKQKNDNLKFQGTFKTPDDGVTIISWILLVAILFLMLINGLLYYKLWGLEDAAAYTVMDLHVLKNTPKTEEEWINLLQQQESLHNVEMRKWQRVLHTAAQLLKQTEESLTELRKSMHPTATDKIFSVLKPHL
ncbi:protein Aster-B-like isoform X2 [Aphidius gifuensis]|uniref:protein Aster-B-like isoform X2 n=1 Tax=Aphidius gifuensis TaxID=684658 RepID=UPI001CDCE5B6|nr:protein Aster-B-like isoform X2 [Aphidius gifuensis]